MIVSHRHRFIMLRTQKTASSSLGTYLATKIDKSCDIFEGLMHDDPVSMGKAFGIYGYVTQSLGGGHKAWPLVKRYWMLSDEQWDSYFKFAVERNPWDKVVSSYYMIHSHTQPNRVNRKKDFDPFTQINNKFTILPSLAEAVKFAHPKGLMDFYRAPNMWYIYAKDDENLAIDKMYFYEDFPGMFEDLNNRFDLGLSMEEFATYKLKSYYRPKGHHYSEYYTPESADLVAKIFKREIKAFNYKFEDRHGIFNKS